MSTEFNRLRWRCQRGMLELDHILVGFLEGGYADASPDVRHAFESLLELDDTDILDLVLGQAPAPPVFAQLISLLRRSRSPGKSY